jgi:thymidylate synthase (FAD)
MALPTTPPTGCPSLCQVHGRHRHRLENWAFANLAAERAYMNLTTAGRKPQEARAVLPLDTNTELVHTAFVSDWLHFFDLRALGTTGAPHPDAKVLAAPLMAEFERLGLIHVD